MALTDEHVLSQAHFGGRLISSRAVCKPCNSAAGKLENELARGPFIGECIGRDGHLFATKQPPRPQAAGTLADGSRVRVAHGPDGATIEAREPRLVDRESDGTQVWEVAAGDEERVRRRLLAKDASAKLRIVGRDPSDAPGLNTSYGFGDPNIDQWPRMGAKVALSLASLVLDDAWLDTPGAKALQDVPARRPWDPAVLGRRGVRWWCWELDPERIEWARLLRPGEHVLNLDPDGRSGLPEAKMVLFGRVAYGIPLPDAEIPPWEPTWHLRPRAPASGPLRPSSCWTGCAGAANKPPPEQRVWTVTDRTVIGPRRLRPVGPVR